MVQTVMTGFPSAHVMNTPQYQAMAAAMSSPANVQLQLQPASAAHDPATVDLDQSSANSQIETLVPDVDQSVVQVETVTSPSSSKTTDETIASQCKS